MTKFFHESPISIFNDVQQVTDGDYALVHLFEENSLYYDLFEQAVEAGREVILDNSIFELGTAFDAERYTYWIRKLNPTWYIVPDVLEDAHETINSFNKFNETYKDLPGKRIAVAQGKTLDEMLMCFNYLHDQESVDMVALSFDLSFYETDPSLSKLENWVNGRQQLISLIIIAYGAGLWNKPVHLLGCALPYEGKAYKNLDFIYSTDTSNPVVAGYEGVRYNERGLSEKSKTKLFTIINEPVPDDKLDIILDNIRDFRRFWGE